MAVQLPPEPAAVAQVPSFAYHEHAFADDGAAGGGIGGGGGGGGGGSSGGGGGGVMDGAMKRMGTITRWLGSDTSAGPDPAEGGEGRVVMLDALRGDGVLLRYREGGSALTLLKLAPGGVAEAARLHLGGGSGGADFFGAAGSVGIRSVLPLAHGAWVVEGTDGHRLLVGGAIDAAFGGGGTASVTRMDCTTAGPEAAGGTGVLPPLLQMSAAPAHTSACSER